MKSKIKECSLRGYQQPSGHSTETPKGLTSLVAQVVQYIELLEQPLRSSDRARAGYGSTVVKSVAFFTSPMLLATPRSRRIYPCFSRTLRWYWTTEDELIAQPSTISLTDGA